MTLPSTPIDGVSFNAAGAGTGSFFYGSDNPSFLNLTAAVAQGELTNGALVSYFAQDNLSSPKQREWGQGTFNSSGSGSIVRTTVYRTVNNGVVGSGAKLNFATPPIVSLTLLSEDLAPNHQALGNNSAVASNVLLQMDEQFVGDFGSNPNNASGIQAFNNFQHTSIAGHKANIFGIQCQVTTNGSSGPFQQINGALLTAENDGTANVHNLFGCEGQSFHEGVGSTISGPGSFMAGIAGASFLGLGIGSLQGSVDKVADVYAEGTNVNGATILSYRAGVIIEPLFDIGGVSPASSIANNYGLYVLDQTTNGTGGSANVTGKTYNIYSNGTTTVNQFDGQVVNRSNVLSPLTFATLPAATAGTMAYITDGLAGNCADGTCTTFGTHVTGGTGALKLLVWYNGTNWTLMGK